MLKDHDPVVSSLSEILDAEEETCFFFRKNKALPEVTELEAAMGATRKWSTAGSAPPALRTRQDASAPQPSDQSAPASPLSRVIRAANQRRAGAALVPRRGQQGAVCPAEPRGRGLLGSVGRGLAVGGVPPWVGGPVCRGPVPTACSLPRVLGAALQSGDPSGSLHGGGPGAEPPEGFGPLRCAGTPQGGLSGPSRAAGGAVGCCGVTLCPPESALPPKPCALPGGTLKGLITCWTSRDGCHWPLKPAATWFPAPCLFLGTGSLRPWQIWGSHAKGNVLSNLLWNSLVFHLDNICTSPAERQTQCLEAQVVAMAVPEQLQCPSSFCAGSKTDSSTKGCRGPWGAAGQLSPVSARKPPLLLSLHLEQAAAQGTRQELGVTIGQLWKVGEPYCHPPSPGKQCSIPEFWHGAGSTLWNMGIAWGCHLLPRGLCLSQLLGKDLGTALCPTSQSPPLHQHCKAKGAGAAGTPAAAVGLPVILQQRHRLFTLGVGCPQAGIGLRQEKVPTAQGQVATSHPLAMSASGPGPLHVLLWAAWQQLGCAQASPSSSSSPLDAEGAQWEQDPKGIRVAGLPTSSCPSVPVTHLLARVTMLGQPGRKGSDPSAPPLTHGPSAGGGQGSQREAGTSQPTAWVPTQHLYQPPQAGRKTEARWGTSRALGAAYQDRGHSGTGCPSSHSTYPSHSGHPGGPPTEEVVAGGRHSALGVTWIRRLMELMSGRSLLPLSKCLERSRPSLRAHLEGSPLVLLLLPLSQEEIQAAQLLKQLCKGNRASSVQEHHPLPSTINKEGQDMAHSGSFAIKGCRRLQATSSPCMVKPVSLTRHCSPLFSLRHHQKGAPALPLLGFENVPKDVVPHVEDVFALHTQEPVTGRGHGWGAVHSPDRAQLGAYHRSRQHSAGEGQCTSPCAASPCPAGRRHCYLCLLGVQSAMNLPCCAHRSPLTLQQGRGPHRVNLAQDGALSKEEGLAGVHHDQVKVGPPGAPWDISLWTPGGGVNKRMLITPCAPHPAHTGDRLTLTSGIITAAPSQGRPLRECKSPCFLTHAAKEVGMPKPPCQGLKTDMAARGMSWVPTQTLPVLQHSPSASPLCPCRAGWTWWWGTWTPPTHVSVGVVTVGGQEDLPHLLHAAQQQRHTGLVRGKSVRGGHKELTEGSRVGRERMVWGWPKSPRVCVWENPGSLSTHHHQPLAHCTHREVDVVHGLAHILVHAAEGHEEVPMLVAGVTAATGCPAEGSSPQDLHLGCRAGQHPRVVGGPGQWGFSLTCEVEEGVEDVEAFHVIPLDELVGVIHGAALHPEGPPAPPCPTFGEFPDSPLEETEAVGTDQQVPVGIHLQQVPVQGIKHQTPAPHSCQWVGGSLPLPSRLWDPLHKLTGWGSQGTCTLQGGKGYVGRGWRNPTTTPPCFRAPPNSLAKRQAPVDKDPGGDHGGSDWVRRGLGLGVAQRKRWGHVSLSQSLVSALEGSCAHPSPGPSQQVIGVEKWAVELEMELELGEGIVSPCLDLSPPGHVDMTPRASAPSRYDKGPEDLPSGPAPLLTCPSPSPGPASPRPAAPITRQSLRIPPQGPGVALPRAPGRRWAPLALAAHRRRLRPPPPAAAALTGLCGPPRPRPGQRRRDGAGAPRAGDPKWGTVRAALHARLPHTGGARRALPARGSAAAVCPAAPLAAGSSRRRIINRGQGPAPPPPRWALRIRPGGDGEDGEAPARGTRRPPPHAAHKAPLETRVCRPKGPLLRHPGDADVGPGPGLDPGRRERPSAHGGAAEQLLCQGCGGTDTGPDTGDRADRQDRSHPQVQGADNPCAGLFTALPMIQGARGALIFGQGREGYGAAFGDPTISQIPRTTGSTGIRRKSLLRGQRAAPRAPEQDGVHSTTAMEAKLNAAEPARGVPHDSPAFCSRAGKDQTLSFSHKITTRRSVEV
ncbi:hypothetical protein DV515_00016332 [Chloebia gouldiae]|uniref:Uncharacterized protein n=1 Tax=Chloebia gouldiae TaxID=44316 RepID=A0A3L8RSZ1_CHLGU|nr:hypothetical protein DV515_00016332 [Chloebia gouldiae]